MTSHGAPRRLPGVIWALGGVSLLMDTSSEMIHSLLPVFLVSVLGASVDALGAIEGAAEATAQFARVLSGPLSDYWRHRKPLTVLGYGVAALSKPLFAVAGGVGMVWVARLVDRVGKGLRGAPRDALVTESVPAALRGAAFGLRQALDTVGAVLGPLLALWLMLRWSGDIRAVFRVAVVPAVAAVLLLVLAVREPGAGAMRTKSRSWHWRQLRGLSSAYWSAISVAAAVMLARFSEAFLMLRAQQGGLALALVPLVLVSMNVVYAASAYPFGRLADRLPASVLLALGLVLLIGADVTLAWSERWPWVWLGIGLWGLHMGATQGLLSKMVADTAPPELLGTAFGGFNFISGVAALLASSVAGLIWAHFGAAAMFLAGATCSAAALLLLLVRQRSARRRR